MNPSHRIAKLQDLDELESWMCKAICTPMSQLDSLTPEPLHYLTPNEQLSAKERLDIYVDDYWSRCFNSLKDDFPVLQHIWGEQKFHTIVEQYLLEHPSSSYSLRNLGDKLQAFILAKYEGQDKGMVLDIIRFEWAKIEAFDNPALPAFDPSKLNKSQKERLTSLSLVFQPHVCLLRLEYPVYEVIDAVAKNTDAKDKITLPAQRETFTVVYRRDLKIYHKEIEKPYFLLLEQMKKGLSLEAACDEILPRLDTKEINRLAKMAKAWFALCVTNRWLVAPGKKKEQS